MGEYEDRLKEASESLVRMQTFDVRTLPREEELGRAMSFEAAVEPAQKLINLYKKLTVSALEDLPLQMLTTIRDKCNADYANFKAILDFDVTKHQNPVTVKDDCISRIANAYPSTFGAFFNLIAYSLHKAADFQSLDAQARATMQGITDRANKIETALQEHEQSAQKALSEIRRVAAEQGLSKQAFYFKTEAKEHDDNSKLWQKYTLWIAGLLALYSVASLFIHKWDFLKPANTYDAIQLSLSKMLIFSVLAYLLFLSAKNYLSHRHNAIVNRHRQNALMTHTALVEAVDDQGIRDAVALNAANCIFSPQSTGYTTGTGSSDNVSSKSVIELLSKVAPKPGDV